MEIQIKVIESPFNKIIAENFPNLGKKTDIQIHKAFRIPNRHNQKKPLHVILQLKFKENRTKTRRARKEKHQVTQRETYHNNSRPLSRNPKARRAWTVVLSPGMK
jgi:hypothetical protein